MDSSLHTLIAFSAGTQTHAQTNTYIHIAKLACSLSKQLQATAVTNSVCILRLARVLAAVSRCHERTSAVVSREPERHVLVWCGEQTTQCTAYACSPRQLTIRCARQSQTRTVVSASMQCSLQHDVMRSKAIRTQQSQTRIYVRTDTHSISIRCARPYPQIL
jgi:hypothetical protein